MPTSLPVLRVTNETGGRFVKQLTGDIDLELDVARRWSLPCDHRSFSCNREFKPRAGPPETFK